MDQHPETLAGLAEKGLDVLCICDRCTRFVPLATRDLSARLGAKMPVPDVRRHVTCGQCGRRDSRDQTELAESRCGT